MNLLALAILVFTSGALAQMSGSYRVDPGGTGSRNFKTFQSAVFAAVQNGISGPVDFVVSPGTHAESWFLVPIRGSSAKNRITFRAEFRNMVALASAGNGTGTIVTMNAGTSTTPVAHIAFDGFRINKNAVAIDARAFTNDIEVRDCWFENTSGGLRANGSHAGWNIHHNTFDNVKDVALSLFSMTGSTIHTNDFRLASKNGINIGTPLATGTLPSRIYNNVLTGRVTHTAIFAAPRSYDLEISHNTIAVNASSTSQSCMEVAGGFFAFAHEIHANILVMLGGGAVLRAEASDSLRFRFDGNLYHTLGRGPIVATKTGTYATLGAWQSTGQDKQSLAGDPKFVGGQLPESLQLQKSSPAVGKAIGTPGYAADDFLGYPRLRPEIGAFEVNPSYRYFGRGCQGTGGWIPQTEFLLVPKIGTQGALVGRQVRGRAGSTVLISGASRTQWGSIPLPLKLGGGCDLLISADILTLRPTILAGNGSSTTTFVLRIPNDPRLQGVQFFLQWAFPDSAARGIGFAHGVGVEVNL